MEGNFIHFMKSRKGRPFATGLVAHMFQQMASGLHHIHSSGYFDMKPENILITTTGIFNYRSPFSQSQPDTVEQKDVSVICKIAYFDLAREISSTPPYTEYISA
ncbi:hypothetical protein K503DRAFT_773036 [Rhizopogon vinicolor AM-OR11-026]|uniref:Protein kinase domain-containing protein n=1 Tax=Rhizopogon vinicolor AM-OR11-026 TaxID=1314800 RepID=A0A1B7MTG0_9AGAM|nr:hypothetical protein K503DRAFT_773036 [Rhizopogon vinicolor AM-OR11-026]